MDAVLRGKIMNGIVRNSDECWLWQKCVTIEGYGHIRLEGHARLVHRVSYEEFIGPIPDGMEIDHFCHSNEKCTGGNVCLHRRCCNPAHLKLATRIENARRRLEKTHCKYGHLYAEENTRFRQGRRLCMICAAETARRFHWKKKGLIAIPRMRRTKYYGL